MNEIYYCSNLQPTNYFPVKQYSDFFSQNYNNLMSNKSYQNLIQKFERWGFFFSFFLMHKETTPNVVPPPWENIGYLSKNNCVNIMELKGKKTKRRKKEKIQPD